MKNLRRKGFTIVELVIVIAVIAVLAAVLIPTFVSITKKANQSADIQATRQMNTVLLTAATDGEIKTVEDAAAALAKAGYNKELKPVSKDHGFYWYPKHNTIILVNGENELVFPTNNKEILENYEKDLAACYNLALGYVKVEVSEVGDLKESFEEGINVHLTKDVTLTIKGNSLLDSSEIKEFTYSCIDSSVFTTTITCSYEVIAGNNPDAEIMDEYFEF